MRILIVDDERAVRDAVASSLAFEGYAVDTAADGAEALEKIAGSGVVGGGAAVSRTAGALGGAAGATSEVPGRAAGAAAATGGAEPYDLVILDVLMPRLDGLTACRRLRAEHNAVPILMLTARDTVGDRVTGLDAGADDYLVKPFELEELLARVRALLRRSLISLKEAADDRPDVLEYDDLRMDIATREVTRAGRSLELTRTEYMLLEMFLRHPRQVLTREQILETVWGFDFEPSSNSLDVYVMYLRRKTELDGMPRIIHTVRGVGYSLRTG
jgi:two-component system response regulator MprA